MNQAETRSLLSRLNTYTSQLDTPAKVENLCVEIKGNDVKTSFKVIPTGNMDALKWNAMNENIEKIIRKFVTDDLNGKLEDDSAKP